MNKHLPPPPNYRSSYVPNLDKEQSYKNSDIEVMLIRHSKTLDFTLDTCLGAQLLCSTLDFAYYITNHMS